MATRVCTPRVAELAEIVWAYHRMNHVMASADVIILLARS
jgi:hypothetical protein